MLRVAFISLALAEALPAAGCMDTMAALREWRVGQTTKQAQQPQADASSWMAWTPLARLQALLQHAALQVPHPANTAKAAIVGSDLKQAEHPVQRPATRPKTLVQPA